MDSVSLGALRLFVPLAFFFLVRIVHKRLKLDIHFLAKHPYYPYCLEGLTGFELLIPFMPLPTQDSAGDSVFCISVVYSIVELARGNQPFNGVQPCGKLTESSLNPGFYVSFV